MTTLYVRDQSGFREAQATDVFDRAQALLAQRYRIGSPVLTSPALRRLRCGVMRPGRRQPRLCRPRREPVMKNTIGRPRKLTDSQVKIILIWHARDLAWRALGNTLKSQRTLARELGVSQATISYVVRRGGEYKQVCPRLARSDQGTRQAGSLSYVGGKFCKENGGAAHSATHCACAPNGARG